MERVKLGDVCNKASSNIAQKDLENNSGEYPIYGASGFIKNVDFYKQEKEYIAVVKDGAGVGRTMILPPYSSVIGTMQYIIPKPNINTKFLFYAISNMNLAKYYSGATIPHIYFKDYQNETLFCYDIKEQERIVSILDKLADLINKRKQQLQKLDELVKARFVEMFGDVKYGSLKWTNKAFGEITVNLDSDRKPVKDADRKRMQGEYPYYGATGVVDYVNEYRQEGTFLLISEDGKALEYRNKPIAFIASGKIWVNNHAHVQQCKDGCNMIYLMHYVNYRDISQWVTGIDQKKLNRENLDSIPISLPPIELQNKFDCFVTWIDKLKLVIQNSLEKLELLKKSLMQEYFG